jgi:hypothetical protein
METIKVTHASQVPQHLQRAAKVALAVGATVRVGVDGESLLVQFKDSDSYHFAPEDITLHAFEALGAARTYGMVAPYLRDLSEVGAPGGAVEVIGWVRKSIVIRTIFSVGDVRVQIGASPWFKDEHLNTAVAMRRALVDAFSTYYDEAIAPYTQA